MRRFVTLVFLLLFTIPFGISISGCGKKTAVVFCQGGSGPVVGQVTAITLQPQIFGISLNFAQIGQVSTPTATDCKGNSVTVSSYTYGVFDANGNANMTIADVVPTTGRLCAGTWNRNTGGGIPDFTTCNPTNKTGTVYVVATGNGAPSNPLPIFVHPVATSVVLGNPTDPANCATDPDKSSNCCPLTTQTTVTAPPYSGNSCLSQGQTGQLVARVYQNATQLPADNITCQVGHLTYAAQNTSVVTIDENGIATAQAPGSSIISANLSAAGSSAGFFSTCPPVSIALTVPGAGNGSSVVVNQNNTQPITAVVKDKNNTVLTNLTLEFVSTTPDTIPAVAAGTVTPLFPGTAQITAICQPPTCNSSSFNQIGLFGNGKPITSNPVTVTTPGTNSTLLYIASTQSRYLVPVDFTTNTLGAPVQLPYVPTSMVISSDGSTIYMGSANELMTFSATTNTLSKEDTTVTGNVLAISPDGTTLVTTDPVRQLVYLYSASGGVLSTYGGVGTRAQFSPDSQIAYITTGTVTTPATATTPAVITPGNQLLVHSVFTGWSTTTLGAPAADVAVTVPSVGAYLAGASTTARSYCPSTTFSADGLTVQNNEFYPLADNASVATDRLSATNDGHHILGATAANTPTLVDFGFAKPLPPLLSSAVQQNDCPPTISPTFFTPSRTSTTTVPLSGITATAINNIIPTSDSTAAIVTYTGSGTLPVYAPATGAITNVTLTGTAVAPVSGVISSDNTTIYVGTTGDNAVHLINRTTLTDDATKTIVPKLRQNINGVDQNTIATPNLLVQHPRKSSS